MDPTQKKTLIARGLITAGIIGVLAVSAPVLVAAASAGVSMMILGGVAAVGFVAVQFLPLIGQKLDNYILAQRKAEAESNPIEQMQNFFLERAEQVRLVGEAATNIEAQVRGLEQRLDKRQKEKPNADLSEQRTQLQQMRDSSKVLTERYCDASDALKELENIIDDEKFKWDFNIAGGQAIKALSNATGEQVISTMLADTAFAAVRDNFNKTFAALDIETTKLNRQKSISIGDGLSIDLSAINIPQRQLAKV